jgi:uncharacterized protein (UPF0335 family)
MVEESHAIDHIINGYRRQVKQLQEKIEKYEEVLKEIADSYAFDDIYDEVTTKRFIAKQVLEKFNK